MVGLGATPTNSKVKIMFIFVFHSFTDTTVMSRTSKSSSFSNISLKFLRIWSLLNYPVK